MAKPCLQTTSEFFKLYRAKKNFTLRGLMSTGRMEMIKLIFGKPVRNVQTSQMTRERCPVVDLVIYSVEGNKTN